MPGKGVYLNLKGADAYFNKIPGRRRGSWEPGGEKRSKKVMLGLHTTQVSETRKQRPGKMKYFLPSN